MITHVIPLKDIKEHVKETTCLCLPKIEVLDNGDLLVIHNAYDGRE